MTNKLPVVGKRYKSISNNCEIEVLAFTQSGTVLINHSFWGEVEQILEEFWNCFEELPEDKPETKPTTQNHISELSPEVKEAMENLRIELDKFYSDLEPVAQNLLNALDKQFANND